MYSITLINLLPPPPTPPPTKKKKKKKVVRSFTARHPCSGFHHCEHRSRSPNERTHSLFIPLPLSIKTNRAFVRSLPGTHTAGSTLVNTTHVHRTNERIVYLCHLCHYPKRIKSCIRSLPGTNTAGSTPVNITHVHRTNEGIVYLFHYPRQFKKKKKGGGWGGFVHCQARIRRVPHS